MLSVIGLGQAGSNIASEAEKLGILSGCINYSQRDLDACDVRYKLRLLGSEGVGKNRTHAIQLFQDQWETAIEFIRDHFSNSKLIAFAFSSSGGSGSGISPILLDVAINMFPEKTFIALVVMPELSEAASSQSNCLATFEELSNLDVAVFPIDNQQIRNSNHLIGKSKLYELSNMESVNLLFKMASYTEQSSKNGNFDQKDLITILRTKGIATITETSLSAELSNLNLTPEGVASKVHQSWSSSVFAPVTSNQISRAAIIFDGQESLTDAIRTELFFDNFVNVPVDVFEGYYHQHTGRVLTILTGLQWSFNRLQDIEISLMSNQDRLKSSVTSYKAATIIPNQTVTKQQKKISVMDILSKYNR